jgi:5-methylthioadenosine/S-adenosylhomocysteine deaminase
MIRDGVTTFADHYFSMDAVAAVVAETGIRAHLGEAVFSSQGAQGRCLAFRDQMRPCGRSTYLSTTTTETLA